MYIKGGFLNKLIFFQQMHVLPDTIITFVNNTASRVGGGISTGNFRAGNDITLILNNACFIQYNIGGEHENQPDLWTVSIIKS